MTWLEMLRSSLRMIGRLAPGQGPGPSETADALVVLNRMLSSWSTEKLIIYTTPRRTYTISAGDATYTIGSGGDFNSARPVRLETAGILISNQEEPLDVIREADRWAGVVNKTLSSVPEAVYYDAAHPLATLTFWPVPDATYTVALYPWEALTSVAALDATAVSLPPGYEEAIGYNWAVRLALEWGKPLRPEVAGMAREAKAAIKRVNITPVRMACDNALLSMSGAGRFDIRTGSWR